MPMKTAGPAIEVCVRPLLTPKAAASSVGVDAERGPNARRGVRDCLDPRNWFGIQYAEFRTFFPRFGLRA